MVQAIILQDFKQLNDDLEEKVMQYILEGYMTRVAIND